MTTSQHCDSLETGKHHLRAPLSGHVADGQPVVDGNAAHGLLRSDKLNTVVQNLVLAEEAAQGDDDVLAGDTRGHDADEVDLGNRGNLPPRLGGSPEGGGVGAHNRGTEGTDTTVAVAVTVTGDVHGAGPGEAALDHDLVADAGAGGAGYVRMRVFKGF